MQTEAESTRGAVNILWLLTISTALLSCGSSVPQTQSPNPEESDTQESSAAVSEVDYSQKRGSPLTKETVRAIVESHNRYRAKHCAPPLKWSKRVAAEAQSWADKLKKKECALVHSKDPALGENIWFGGPPGAIPLENSVDTWYAEIEEYNFKSAKFSADTGHFTQLVWRDSTEIGCGAATCPEGDILVCNYSPGGNVIGQFKEKVRKPSACRKK